MILPLSKPVIATVGLFYAVGHWNDFFSGLFFISDNSKWPLQMVLRSIIIDFNMLNMGAQNTSTFERFEQPMVVQPENIKAATIIFAIVPILDRVSVSAEVFRQRHHARFRQRLTCRPAKERLNEQ